MAGTKAGGKRRLEDARGLILKTAVRHFVANGYAGARVDEIIAEAGFSKNLLYHYFGSKEELFGAVLEATYEMFRTRLSELAVEDEHPLEGLRRLITGTFEILQETPEIISIMNTENLHKGVHIQKSTRIRYMYRPFLKQMQTVLSAGEAAGLFRAGIEPTQVYISLSSLPYHYFSNRYTLSAAIAQDLFTRRNIQKRREHVAELILRFCLRPEFQHLAVQP